MKKIFFGCIQLRALFTPLTLLSLTAFCIFHVLSFIFLLILSDKVSMAMHFCDANSTCVMEKLCIHRNCRPLDNLHVNFAGSFAQFHHNSN